jgi:putative copper export protein
LRDSAAPFAHSRSSEQRPLEFMPTAYSTAACIMSSDGLQPDVVIFHVIALMAGSVMLGLPAFLYICLPMLPATTWPSRRLRRGAKRTLWLAGTIDLAATAGWLVTAGAVQEPWDALCGQSASLSITGQAAGKILIVHAALVVGFLAALLVRSDRLRTPILIFFAFEASISLAWIGHAIDPNETAGLLPLALSLVQKVASGLCAGMFVGLLLLSGSRQSDSIDDLRIIDGLLSHRIFPITISCALGLLATEAGRTILFVGDIPRLIGTSYGQLVAVESFLVVLMLTLAIQHIRARTSGGIRSGLQPPRA